MRVGSFFPSLLEPRRRMDKALWAAAQLASAQLSAGARQVIEVTLRAIDHLLGEAEPLRAQLRHIAATQPLPGPSKRASSASVGSRPRHLGGDGRLPPLRCKADSPQLRGSLRRMLHSPGESTGFSWKLLRRPPRVVPSRLCSTRSTYRKHLP